MEIEFGDRGDGGPKWRAFPLDAQNITVERWETTFDKKTGEPREGWKRCDRYFGDYGSALAWVMGEEVRGDPGVCKSLEEAVRAIERTEERFAVDVKRAVKALDKSRRKAGR